MVCQKQVSGDIGNDKWDKKIIFETGWELNIWSQSINTMSSPASSQTGRSHFQRHPNPRTRYIKVKSKTRFPGLMGWVSGVRGSVSRLVRFSNCLVVWVGEPD